jgi:BirA family biotin operon repressor/biotin-[acetyl-CoA-carboxylase] ligase
MRKLEKTYSLFEQQGFAPILAEWKKYAAFLGQEVEVTNQHEKIVGLALDVDEQGALILRLENGKIRRACVGDVSLRIS